MRIPIDHTKLIDSPYSKSNGNHFDFTTSDTEGFVQDIINGNPTCYLISGYRGAGKSSFIRKLEIDIKKTENKILFVCLNFAKHEERSILLRKLIRNFYLSFKESELFETVKSNDELKSPLHDFSELYERTFYEVSKNTNERKTTTTTSIFGYRATLKDILLTGTALFSVIAFSIGLDLTQWYSYIPIGGSVIWSIAQFFYLETKREKQNTHTDEIAKNSFYDDEIAEHYLVEVLKSFQNHIKPVFILDELDKINDDELVQSLMNELKPIMLSGLASFIVVAGQNLYFNYYDSQTKDDQALSSLFSKVHHVPLFSVSELRLLFRKIIKVDEKTEAYLDTPVGECYMDYLVFESKRIPRRFINLIRQNIVWENNEAFLEIGKTIDELSIYSKILRRIENIDDQEIAPKGYPDPIRDYFNMQLLLRAHYILGNQDLVFTAIDLSYENGE